MKLCDPATNNALLAAQLRSLGLYAVETIGDGNCLFRALSDQLYGSPNYHLQLRAEICDWITSHQTRYEPFVEDDRGIEVHLRNMRTRGTYGGHLELSAFAHLKHRNVKVIQPGLVYVIEWDGGESSVSKDSKRWKGKSKESDTPGEEEEQGAVYIAYHDWEHFSSIRSLRGPHQGLPHVVEVPQPSPPPVQVNKPLSPLSPTPRNAIANLPPEPEVPIVQPPITLPPSPPPSSQGSSRLTSASATSLHAPDDTITPTASIIRHEPSPKRSFEESRGLEPHQQSPYRDKKARSCAYLDIDTEHLSALSSLRSTPAPDTESYSSSPAPESVAYTNKLRVPPRERPLTRRQRKALGLPKSRPLTPGKIIIPGGKHPKRQGKGWVIVSEDEGDSSTNGDKEWIRNGTGRVDVRGFKELRI